MCSCSYRDKVTCAKKVNNNIHDGTKLKFNAFERYTKAWLEKIVLFNKKRGFELKNVNFIDCMASSGLYFDSKQNEFYEGTAIRMFKLFVNSAIKYKDLHFNIILNDINTQFVKCLKCVQENIIKVPENLYIHITEMDKNEFINSLIFRKEINGFDSKSLIIYDPYGVDFNWNYLSNVLDLDADFLLTHFFPNDIKRNINAMKPEVVSRYEEAYRMNIDEIRERFNKESDSFKRNAFFRSRLHEMLKKFSNKQYLAYAPVIINKNLHIYDIVCLSHSSHAQALLKNTMYSLYKEYENEKKKENFIQLSFFDNNNLEDRYQNDRSSGLSEYKFHYDDSHIYQMFYDEFKMQKLSETEFKRRLREHPYLPTNILNMIKKIYKYKIEKENIDGKIIKYYIFPDRGYNV